MMTLLERFAEVLEDHLRRGHSPRVTGHQLAEALLAAVPVRDGLQSRLPLCWRCRHPLSFTTDGHGNTVEDCRTCRDELAQLARGVRIIYRAVPAAIIQIQPLDVLCACGNPIPYRGRGRPPKRCPLCQARGKRKLAA